MAASWYAQHTMFHRTESNRMKSKLRWAACTHMQKAHPLASSSSIIKIPKWNIVPTIAVKPDGRILVCSNYSTTGYGDGWISRVHEFTEGATTGVLVIDNIEIPKWTTVPTISVEPDGRILICCNHGAPGQSGAMSWVGRVLRFTEGETTGELVASELVIDNIKTPQWGVVPTIAVRADGRILVCSNFNVGKQGELPKWRGLVHEFPREGTAAGTVGHLLIDNIKNPQWTAVSTIAIQPDGRILVCSNGAAGSAANGSRQWAGRIHSFPPEGALAALPAAAESMGAPLEV